MQNDRSVEYNKNTSDMRILFTPQRPASIMVLQVQGHTYCKYPPQCKKIYIKGSAGSMFFFSHYDIHPVYVKKTSGTHLQRYFILIRNILRDILLYNHNQHFLLFLMWLFK